MKTNPLKKQNNKKTNIPIRNVEEHSPPVNKTAIYDSKNNINLNLSKNHYGAKEAFSSLDREFNQFIPKTYSIDNFFNLYSRLFYDIHPDTHKHFINKSATYAFPTGYVSPLMQEYLDLEEQLKNLQKQIDSIEKEHTFFKNGNFLMDNLYKNSSNGALESGGDIYYMQSAKKRKIINTPTFINLKDKMYKHQSSVPNEDIIVFVDAPTINHIPNGPDINSLDDIYIDVFEINIYPRTIENYDPLFEEPQNNVTTNTRS